MDLMSNHGINSDRAATCSFSSSWLKMAVCNIHAPPDLPVSKCPKHPAAMQILEEVDLNNA